jgi:hypothetical protein
MVPLTAQAHELLASVGLAAATDLDHGQQRSGELSLDRR